jgi:hypothetical protein
MTSSVALGLGGLILSAATIAAVFLGPIQALKMQRKLDDEREARNRKLSIYKTLMSNRATRLSPAYVQALNQIDVEFTGSSADEKAVREAWKELLDLYGSWKNTQNPGDKAADQTAAMLAAMGRCLGYDFDKVYIKKGVYYPELFGDIEKELHAVRKGILALLDGSGRTKIPVAVFEQRFPDVIPPSSDSPPILRSDSVRDPRNSSQPER